MDLLIAFIIFTVSMLWCLLTGVTMVAALLVGYVCFVAVALRCGNKPADLLSIEPDIAISEFTFCNI